jgi:hypothetical protein
LCTDFGPVDPSAIPARLEKFRIIVVSEDYAHAETKRARLGVERLFDQTLKFPGREEFLKCVRLGQKTVPVGARVRIRLLAANHRRDEQHTLG